VLTGADEFVEVQGTAEQKPFSSAVMDELIELAKAGIGQLFEMQRTALGQ
jgi:ribonuclease PH